MVKVLLGIDVGDGFRGAGKGRGVDLEGVGCGVDFVLGDVHAPWGVLRVDIGGLVVVFAYCLLWVRSGGYGGVLLALVDGAVGAAARSEVVSGDVECVAERIAFVEPSDDGVFVKVGGRSGGGENVEDFVWPERWVV